MFDPIISVYRSKLGTQWTSFPVDDVRFDDFAEGDGYAEAVRYTYNQ